MPELNTATVYEAPSGAIYPAVVKETDAGAGLVFIEYFSLALCKWLTGWRPVTSLWL